MAVGWQRQGAGVEESNTKKKKRILEGYLGVEVSEQSQALSVEGLQEYSPYKPLPSSLKGVQGG